MNAHTKIEGVAIDADLIARAEAHGIDVIQACESALYMRLRRLPDSRTAEEKRMADERWAEENRRAMEAWNDWLDRNGMPFAEYRLI